MHVNYILAHMYYLKYFLPLIIEGNKRNIDARVFTFYKDDEFEKCKSVQYHPYANLEYIEEMSQKFRFKFSLCKDDNEIEGLTFLVEKRGLSNLLNHKSFKVILVSLLEFANDGWYEGYIDRVDSVIFPSEFLARNYGKLSSKNLYFGSPKYDIEINKNDILKKYNITSNKNVLIFFPGLEFYKKLDLNSIYNTLSEMGFTLIIKGRHKQEAPLPFRGDKYISDSCWFPSESMELINACDIVVGFDTGAIEECVLLRKPYINFHASKWFPYTYFYKHGCCVNLLPNVKPDRFYSVINKMVSTNFDMEFDDIKNKYLFNKNDVCKNILDYFENRHLI